MAVEADVEGAAADEEGLGGIGDGHHPIIAQLPMSQAPRIASLRPFRARAPLSHRMAGDTRSTLKRSGRRRRKGCSRCSKSGRANGSSLLLESRWPVASRVGP
jgi:hypothetical protein